VASESPPLHPHALIRRVGRQACVSGASCDWSRARLHEWILVLFLPTAVVEGLRAVSDGGLDSLGGKRFGENLGIRGSGTAVPISRSKEAEEGDPGTIWEICSRWSTGSGTCRGSPLRGPRR